MICAFQTPTLCRVFYEKEEVHELVQIVLISVDKIKSTRTEVVDGSNESIGRADQELDSLLRKYTPDFL